MTKFYDCGICGHWHPLEWSGDCREDANRFTTADLDRHWGLDNWDEMEMPT